MAEGLSKLCGLSTKHRFLYTTTVADDFNQFVLRIKSIIQSVDLREEGANLRLCQMEGRDKNLISISALNTALPPPHTHSPVTSWSPLL
ncbi:hypothetical protein RRG08_017889 [Elysia crispata]|uniref:Uncharacterized protein n=1 Tax=Elysia crispata TaxID=231223 RepID=A0AAE1CKG8_9GAST|nr:hypothetical protein RRG08_017889 [Elysia crispata]